MNILLIKYFFVGIMVSDIPKVSVFGHCQYSVTFPYIYIIIIILIRLYIIYIYILARSLFIITIFVLYFLFILKYFN